MVSGFISATTSFALATIKLRAIFIYFFLQIKTATDLKKHNKKTYHLYFNESVDRPQNIYRVYFSLLDLKPGH